MKPRQEPEEQIAVSVSCGFVVEIPSSQLPDYYRAHGWFAALGMVVALIRLTFLLA